MSNDVLDRRFRPSESLVRQGVKALMAAPMVVFEETIGVIYVDSSDPAACFEQEDLELLAGLAALAAVALDNALHLRNLEGENRQLAAELNLRHNMVGESAAMRGVLEFISKVAQTGSTILLRGESGTGKELVARAIHQNSRRARKPFVAINCAALTETLLESELFGHEKGAFTGAVAQKKGKFEEAQGGTVFLDEVGELAPVLQAKLLRVLQEREFERVGGTRPIKADIRLLAATNRDLEDAVQQGTFRQDLYYRLNVVSLTAPPMRERKDDVPLLANYFAQKHARNVCRRITGISAEALSLMLNYDWPGNVRELENAVERAVVLGSTDTILPEDLPESLLEAGQPAGAGFHGALKDAKKQIVLDALQQTQGNYAEAARLLGLHPSNLHRLIRSLGLRGQLKIPPHCRP